MKCIRKGTITQTVPRGTAIQATVTQQKHFELDWLYHGQPVALTPGNKMVHGKHVIGIIHMGGHVIRIIHK